MNSYKAHNETLVYNCNKSIKVSRSLWIVSDVNLLAPNRTLWLSVEHNILLDSLWLLSLLVILQFYFPIACELYARCVRQRYHYTILKYMPVLGATNYKYTC